jgi:hypothetical protein
MPPFATDRVRARNYLSTYANTAANTCSRDNPENALLSFACPIFGFGQGKAICIIGGAHFAVENCTNVAVEWMAIEPGRIRIFNEASAGTDRTRDSDADCASDAEPFLGVAYQISDRAYRCVIIMTWGSAPLAQLFIAIVIQCNDFNFGSAEVYTYSHDLLSSCNRMKVSASSQLSARKWA